MEIKAIRIYIIRLQVIPVVVREWGQTEVTRRSRRQKLTRCRRSGVSPAHDNCPNIPPSRHFFFTPCEGPRASRKQRIKNLLRSMAELGIRHLLDGQHHACLVRQSMQQQHDPLMVAHLSFKDRLEPLKMTCTNVHESSW